MSYTEQVAAEINKSVAQLGADNFGLRRAFVSEVFANLQARRVTHTDLASFKALLLVLQRAGLVSLGRCDMVEAYDHRIVQESEIDREGSRFHFIKIYS